MVKNIMIGKVQVTVNIEDILKEANDTHYYPENYTGQGEYHKHDEYSFTEEEWQKGKDNFIRDIKSLEEDSILIDVLTKNMKVNKNGSLPKVMKNIIFRNDVVSGYNDTYGSHGYYVECVRVLNISEFAGMLTYDSLKEQSSF